MAEWSSILFLFFACLVLFVCLVCLVLFVCLFVGLVVLLLSNTLLLNFFYERAVLWLGLD
jgi:hypothetical protein